MQIAEGPGWRLSADPARHPYCGLVGSQDWAVELRGAELRALARGVATLVDQHRQLSDTLMADEQITLELDLELQEADQEDRPPPRGGGSLHLALEGDAGSWCLRFVLTPSDETRGVEGGWSAAASLPLAAALAGLAIP